jgi:hypothetical protein
MPVGLEESFVYMNKISEKNQRGGTNNE